MLLTEPLNAPLDYLQSGGGVIVPLIAVSVWMWALIFKKWLAFFRMRSRERPIWECLDRYGRSDFSAAPWQEKMLQIYMEYSLRGLRPSKKSINRVRRSEGAAIDRFVGTILVLAAIAPLLGLLGTVIGMVATFDVIARFGTTNARAMAGGISEALITTQAGLIVAVPGLIMGNVLRRRAEGIKGRMEQFSLSLLREAAPRSQAAHEESEEAS